MTDPERSREGGCLCGAVRYRCVGKPLWVAHCHCNSCRRACGSVILPWAGYASKAFSIIEGEPHRFESYVRPPRHSSRNIVGGLGCDLKFAADRFFDFIRVAPIILR